MKKLPLILAGFLLVACQKEALTPENSTIVEADAQEVLSISQINEVITAQIETTGDMIWSDPLVLWSAAMHGDKIITVGYGIENQYFAANKSSALIQLQHKIVSVIQEIEQTTTEELLLSKDAVLNVMDVKVNSLASVKALMKQDGIRYLEPNGYTHYVTSVPSLAQKSGAACNPISEDFHTDDYTTISPNAKMPWNFRAHHVGQAWNSSTGAGVTIGLIDTGISSNQNLLDSGFNDGFSSGRKVERYGTFIDSPWFWSRSTDGPDDQCGHGTTMASVMASPRNDDEAPLGVAYNSNLVAYRAVEDVLITDYHEKKGVSNALIALANRSDVKIISMSIGWVFSIGNVRDAIQYANSKGKLIFAAAGTSTSFTNVVGVIFPANMSETVAVTGITDDGNYTRCNNCHSGSKVDFAMVMQRAGIADRSVPTLSFRTNEAKYTGGSSIATAMTAGIAALVWSKNPGWTKNQVLNKLQASSDFYPNKSSQYGYGIIDAFQAVQ